ncbi:hypothetical protein GGR55DRAFT_351406 [Xylaria sp. FL0064]|nr:hypothetical protein GGR55DRAFT_351406 [Xylaria sp. FL0064]
MNPNISINYHEPNVKGGGSHIEETSDLIFSFDNDIETGASAMDFTSQQPCSSISLRSSSSSSSTSQSGYVMISYPSTGADAEPSFTDSFNPKISPRDRMVSKDKSRGARRLSSTRLPINPSPQLDLEEHSYTQRSSSSRLQAPPESPHSPTPESTTPRTRRFQDNMLSLLSLLPSERYLSPSPSNEEYQFEDGVEIRGYGPGAYPTCSGSSAPATYCL